MGGGDLNLKKSWHTQTLQNIEKVWKAELQAEEEKRKTGILKKEKEKERQLEELQRTYEDAGFKKRGERLDWMYQGPSAQARDLSEEYLLGKRRVDEKLKDDANGLVETVVSIPAGLTDKQTLAKLREDPLWEIRKKETQQIDQTLQNPLKLKHILEMRQKLEHSYSHGEEKTQQSIQKRSRDEEVGHHSSSKFSERKGQRDRPHASSKKDAHGESRNVRQKNHHKTKPSLSKEEMNKKLRAMQEDAEWHDQERSKRCKEVDVQERKITENDKKSATNSESAPFIDSIHRQVYSGDRAMSMEERIKRQIHYVQKANAL
jgi:hypothetical protein